ncbi:hypothetical protein C8N36_10143 [Pelagimonas varians]|nr:hypothetical protein C8N36_10143 [Pelagimonas varians]
MRGDGYYSWLGWVDRSGHIQVRGGAATKVFCFGEPCSPLKLTRNLDPGVSRHPSTHLNQACRRMPLNTVKRARHSACQPYSNPE